MTVRETAPLLGVSAASLYRAIAEGRSPVETVRCGSRVVVVTADVRRVLHLDDALSPDASERPEGRSVRESRPQLHEGNGGRHNAS